MCPSLCCFLNIQKPCNYPRFLYCRYIPKQFNKKQWISCSRILCGLQERLVWQAVFLIYVRTYHRVLCLDGFDLEAVVHPSGGTVGLNLALHTFCTMLEIRLILPIAFGWLRSRRRVASLFLGDVGFGSVDCLHMLPERAGVRVTLCTARDLTHIWFLQKKAKFWSSTAYEI